jgi:asparagine synthase (glutamine-hydrolysing)
VESTFFTRVRKLPQARTMRVGPEGHSLRKYWTPGGGKKTRFGDEAAYAKAMFELVEDAIGRRVRYYAGEKLGTELSGGQDSSVVSVLVRRELKKAGQTPAAYSWSPPFEVVKRLPRDERIQIELISRQEDMPCVYCDPRQAVPVDVLCTPMITDKPCGSKLFMEASHMRSLGVRAVFTGWGGDQAISHRANMFSLLLSGYWGCFLKEAVREAQRSPIRFAKSVVRNTVMPLFAPYGVFGGSPRDLPEIANEVFMKRTKRRCKRSVLLFKLNPVKHFDSPDIPSRTEMTAWLGAEYQIQYLFPFLDHRLVDFALSIPRHLFFKQGMSRYIYRKAFAGILPEWVSLYPHKDDVAMSAAHDSDTLPRQYVAPADMLNRDLFSPYIDWDRFDAAMEKSYSTEDPGESRHPIRTAMTCVILQRMMEEAEKARFSGR